MSDQAHGKTQHKAFLLAGVAFISATTANYAAVKIGYEPFFWCYGKAFVLASSLNIWWETAVYALVVGSLVMGCWKGVGKALPLIIVAGVMIAIPSWLEQGLRLGRYCTADLAGDAMIGLAPMPPPPLPVAREIPTRGIDY